MGLKLYISRQRSCQLRHVTVTKHGRLEVLANSLNPFPQFIIVSTRWRQARPDRQSIKLWTSGNDDTRDE
jgi:hypothetical protein